MPLFFLLAWLADSTAGITFQCLQIKNPSNKWVLKILSRGVKGNCWTQNTFKNRALKNAQFITTQCNYLIFSDTFNFIHKAQLWVWGTVVSMMKSFSERNMRCFASYSKWHSNMEIWCLPKHHMHFSGSQIIFKSIGVIY